MTTQFLIINTNACHTVEVMYEMTTQWLYKTKTTIGLDYFLGFDSSMVDKTNHLTHNCIRQNLHTVASTSLIIEQNI